MDPLPIARCPLRFLTYELFAYPSMVGWLGVVLALGLSAGWLTRRRKNILSILGQWSTGPADASARLILRRRWTSGLRIAGLLCFVAALAGPSSIQTRGV